MELKLHFCKIRITITTHAYHKKDNLKKTKGTKRTKLSIANLYNSLTQKCFVEEHSGT